MTKEQDIGTYMHQLMVKLFPICRSITGDGVRKTLEIIANEIQCTDAAEYRLCRFIFVGSGAWNSNRIV